MAKKERKLSAAEIKRKEMFEAQAKELERQGYIKKDLTITPLAANIWGFAIMIPIITLFYFAFFSLHQQVSVVITDFTSCILYLAIFFVLLVVHECIHGLTWAIFARGHLKSIAFGVIWTMLTPYCTCNEALTKSQYLIGALSPTIILGIVPAIVAIIYGNMPLFFLSILMILGGGGDALIALKLISHKASVKGSIYMDHPYECGIVAFEPAA